MKKIVHITKSLAVFLFLVFFTSCDDLFNLDVVPPDLISADLVFQNEATAQANMDDLYQRFPFIGVGYANWHQIGQHDMGTLRDGFWNNCRNFGGMNLNSDCHGFWNYVYIRDINFFIEGIQNAPLPEIFKRRLEGEGRALRAAVYFEKQRRYGGVPLIDVVLDPFEDVPEGYRVRSTEEELADFIDNELEIAAGLLGTNPSRKGRINRWTAYAYKARANLWSASIAKFGTLADNRLTGIPAARANEFYEKASAAARAVINSGNYSLLQGSDPVETHYGILVEDSNSEVIYERLYNGVELGHNHAHHAQPPTYSQGGGAMYNPTLELLHFFENLDGTFTTAELGPDKLYPTGKAPWLGKDPRLYATVFFEGDLYAGLPITLYEGIDPTVGGTNPAAIIAEVGVSYQGKPTVGSDSRRNGNSVFWPYTNFLLRKSVPETPLIPPGQESSNWVEFRLAEMYLIVAESEFEIGNLAEAATYLNFTRERVGLIPFNAGTITRDRLRIERTSELIYEGHRWYDLRRWRIAEQILDGREVKGVRCIYHFDSGQYYFLEINGEQAQRIFRPEHYYNPITRGRIQQFGLLEENPGY